MIITNNLLSANAALHLGHVVKGKNKSMEKLASGYRVNRAADDAAGLAISEKMRSQARGLMRAAQNTTDGISFVQTTDGATDQAGNILQRMRELTIEALNTAVNTEEDRAKIQLEFDQLQSELDRINDQTEFNKKECFHHYETDHYVTEGNIQWVQDQIHIIDNRNNSMTIQYKTEPDTEDENGNPVVSPERTVTIRVPNGTYTTQQLADEIDDAFTALGLDPERMALEYTDRGTCNLVLDNGAEITDMSGGLTYLFHDEYAGSEVGSLIGTTLFEPGTNGLQIHSGHNDHMEFTIKYLDGRGTRPMSITIPTTPDDFYTRDEMISFLNEKLARTDVSAIEYGDKSIMLGSDKAIVTGLRGNMFEIDDPNEPGSIIATSVFYDNTKYGRTTLEPAVFTGGDVINENDLWLQKIKISDENNLLRVRVNDSTGEYKDVRLNNGNYTRNQMITELNRAFNAAGAGLKAYAKDTSTTVRMANGTNITLTGFQIRTTDSGKNCSIDFDPSTKAYQTLFTDRVYTNEGKAIQTNTSQQYSVYKNSLIGGKVFAAGSNLPLTINDSNHSLTLSLYETPYNGSSSRKNYSLTLANGTYSSADDIVTALNNSIAAAGISDKVSARVNAGRIQLDPSSTNKTVGYRNSAYNTISCSGTAYTPLFVGSHSNPNEGESLTSSSAKQPELTITENPLPDNPRGNLTYHFKVRNEDRYVSFPNDSYTKEDFLARLNEGLAAQPDTVTSKSATASSTAGTTSSKNVSRSANGTESESTSIVANAHGTGVQQQGTTEQTQMTPASYTVPVALPNTMTLDDNSNDIRITVNGTTYQVALTEKTYSSRSELVSEIQTQLDSAISRNGDKMKVSLDGSNRLYFESVQSGQNVSFSFGNERGVGAASASGFFHELTATKSAATVATNLALQNTIQIPAGATLSMTVNGVNRSISWDAAANYTNKNTFLSDLNEKLRDIGVVASGTSALSFSTIAKGRGNSLSLNTANSPEICNAMFGEMITKTPATMTLNRALKADSEDVPMKAGENTFSIRVGSTTYTSTFDVGTNYTRQQILDKLNTDFSGVATATMSGGTLSFRTVQTGANTTIALGSSTLTSGGLFGESVTHHPGVTATETPEGYLKLTGTNEETYQYSISMFRKDGSDILPAHQQSVTDNPTTSGFSTQSVGVYKASSSHALQEPVVITSENNKLSFTVYRNGTASSHTITVPDGNYTVQNLEQALQNSLNSAIGANELTVSHNSLPGLAFSSEPRYNISNVTNWGGSFYSRIIKGDAEATETVATASRNGKQTVGDTYIVGRKDVRNQTTIISPNTNDSFSLELWKDNTKYNFSFKLNPGSYSSDQLVSMMNRKLSEAAVANGLPADIVRADVGRYHTGVVGSDDSNALDFYLNPEVELQPGRYKIEGLEGDSLFDIFYKTVGNLTAAYTTGTKDLTGGVEIPEGKQDFSLVVDGTTYNYRIDPAGHYTGEEFVNKLNELIQSTNPNAPISASLSRGAVKFSHDSIGKHTVTSVRGPAIQAFYYENDAAYGEDDNLWLQVGANAGQGITFRRYSVSSHALNVNTVNVTEKKYADKALDRIDEAMGRLMTNRSRFGALQNRLEFTRDVDTNSAINIQESESRIRDTDMAEEMMRLSMKNILEQAGMSVLSQAIRQPQNVLSLLR